MAGFPPEVEAFHNAMQRLRGVGEVTTGVKQLSEFPPETYSMPGEFGDLPHALLRRTAGGHPGEEWVHTEFTLTKDEAGWLSLEFISWWVRDLSRSGVQIQLRPMAMPPVAQRTQFGKTLWFILDQFVVSPPGDNEFLLRLMQERAESLSENIDDYAEVLGELCGAPKRKGWFGRGR